ncbi:MAG: MFS transporter [Candidatus Rokubacteria bacterium]|nr:MFS transporter [Candidatus Rokubacteria bacterium]
MSQPSRIHPAWIVLGALTLCMMAASGIRAVFGVYIKPMEAEFGWTRGALSGAAAISLLLLGAVGPVWGRLADRWGPRKIVGIALVLLGIGALGSAFVQQLWHLYVSTSLMALGAGGAAMTTGSAVISRWFEGRRGLAMGIAGGAMSAGQLVVIPLATGLTLAYGWRTSFIWLGVALFLLVLPLTLALLRNDPEERGLAPYGATGRAQTSAEVAAAQKAGRVGFGEASRAPQFWLLMATFFVCGYTSNGMVLTHFMPHALEHNFTEIQASTALGVMGAMNVLGTIGSGWICDRFGRRGPLAFYYFMRGISLIFLLYVWNAPSLHLWAAIFGLNYISTVPPTTTLTANIFGRFSVGELSGWIFFAHQVGSALGAALAGWIFEWTGSYSPAFISAAVMAIVAAGLSLAIREQPVVRTPPLAPAPAAAG